MLRNAVVNALFQISDILDNVEKISEEEALKFYCDSNAGKHVRHVLDHFLAFLSALETGVLNYNTRNRESVIEQDWKAAKVQLNDIVTALEASSLEKKELKVISEIDVAYTKSDSFHSNSLRELLYLINHTMHHAAYIKLLAQNCNIALPEHIGLAPSTASYYRETGS